MEDRGLSIGLFVILGIIVILAIDFVYQNVRRYLARKRRLSDNLAVLMANEDILIKPIMEGRSSDLFCHIACLVEMHKQHFSVSFYNDIVEVLTATLVDKNIDSKYLYTHYSIETQLSPDEIANRISRVLYKSVFTAHEVFQNQDELEMLKVHSSFYTKGTYPDIQASTGNPETADRQPGDVHGSPNT